MKFKDFRKQMKKAVFSTAEAQVVAFRESRELMNLQLHQWKKAGDIVALKRGVYAFADARPNSAEVAKALYFPCYFSLEYALNFYGMMPEAVFTYTLVTPKATRSFANPMGRFSFRSIQQKAFTGFDPVTLMAEPEKALVDYFYLNSAHLQPEPQFWQDLRLEAGPIDFKKLFFYAELFQSSKLIHLLKSFKNYAKSQ